MKTNKRQTDNGMDDIHHLGVSFPLLEVNWNNTVQSINVPIYL